MRKFKSLGFALYVLGTIILCGLALTAADKQKSDKQRIEALEFQVVELKADLEGAHNWAVQVDGALELLDKQVWDLHSRLLRVETRGPVAELAHAGLISGVERASLTQE